MELSQLFSRGSHLSDVPPDFRGMPYWEWRWKLHRMEAERHAAKLKAAGVEPPLNKKGIQHPKVFVPENGT